MGCGCGLKFTGGYRKRVTRRRKSKKQTRRRR